jgi:hypothetical protein
MIKDIVLILLAVVIFYSAVKIGEDRASQKNYDNCLTYFERMPLHDIKPLCQDIMDGISKTDPYEDPELHR